ncbi:MAG: hypothetical protein AAFN74_11300 [Myxococcota bacterium]
MKKYTKASVSLLAGVVVAGVVGMPMPCHAEDTASPSPVTERRAVRSSKSSTGIQGGFRGGALGGGITYSRYLGHKGPFLFSTQSVLFITGESFNDFITVYQFSGEQRGVVTYDILSWVGVYAGIGLGARYTAVSVDDGRNSAILTSGAGIIVPTFVGATLSIADSFEVGIEAGGLYDTRFEDVDSIVAVTAGLRL